MELTTLFHGRLLLNDLVRFASKLPVVECVMIKAIEVFLSVLLCISLMRSAIERTISPNRTPDQFTDSIVYSRVELGTFDLSAKSAPGIKKIEEHSYKITLSASIPWDEVIWEYGKWNPKVNSYCISNQFILWPLIFEWNLTSNAERSVDIWDSSSKTWFFKELYDFCSLTLRLTTLCFNHRESNWWMTLHQIQS